MADTVTMRRHLSRVRDYWLSSEVRPQFLPVRDGEQETAKAFGVRDLKSGRSAEVTDRLWISGAGTSILAVSVMKHAR